jgi:hypothetical protein
MHEQLGFPFSDPSQPCPCSSRRAFQAFVLPLRPSHLMEIDAMAEWGHGARVERGVIRKPAPNDGLTSLARSSGGGPRGEHELAQRMHGPVAASWRSRQRRPRRGRTPRRHRWADHDPGSSGSRRRSSTTRSAWSNSAATSRTHHSPAPRPPGRRRGGAPPAPGCASTRPRRLGAPPPPGCPATICPSCPRVCAWIRALPPRVGGVRSPTTRRLFPASRHGEPWTERSGFAMQRFILPGR